MLYSFIILGITDLLIPLKKTPYQWDLYLNLVGLEAAMKRYFPAKCVSKAVIRKDQNYLVSGHPHGLW